MSPRLSLKDIQTYLDTNTRSRCSLALGPKAWALKFVVADRITFSFMGFINTDSGKEDKIQATKSKFTLLDQERGRERESFAWGRV